MKNKNRYLKKNMKCGKCSVRMNKETISTGEEIWRCPKCNTWYLII